MRPSGAPIPKHPCERHTRDSSADEHYCGSQLTGDPLVDKHHPSNAQTAAEELYELTKAYVRQETIDPLRSVGRRLGYGLLGSLFVGVGSILVTSAVLRLVPQHLTFASRGFLSSLVYFVMALGLLGVVGVSWKVLMQRR